MPRTWCIVESLEDRGALVALLDRLETQTGEEPMTEPSPGWLEGERRHALGFDDAGVLTGYAALAVTPKGCEAEPAISTLDDGLCRLVADQDGEVRVLLRGPDIERGAGLGAMGFETVRSIVRLRRPLPAPPPSLPAGVTMRPFVPGRDEVAWVEQNNAAFVEDPYQSAMTPDRLRTKEEAPWFDPDGFLLFEDDAGRLLASCWTKVHGYPRGSIGEIYVISVAPFAQGRGLGRVAVLAGLEHLAGLGLTLSELYVREDNLAARSLYERLGFAGDFRVVELARPAGQWAPTARPIT